MNYVNYEVSGEHSLAGSAFGITLGDVDINRQDGPYRTNILRRLHSTGTVLPQSAVAYSRLGYSFPRQVCSCMSCVNDHPVRVDKTWLFSRSQYRLFTAA